jgi:hypothetical protein
MPRSCRSRPYCVMPVTADPGPVVDMEYGVLVAGWPSLSPLRIILNMLSKPLIYIVKGDYAFIQ